MGDTGQKLQEIQERVAGDTGKKLQQILENCGSYLRKFWGLQEGILRDIEEIYGKCQSYESYQS